MHARRAYESERAANAAEQRRCETELAALRSEIAALTPDASQYEIVEAEPVGRHLVLRVRYPSCEHRSFEGEKVLVILDVAPVDALRWRRLDPHFTDQPQASLQDAPSPAARFPATSEGWADALTYARGKAAHARR